MGAPVRSATPRSPSTGRRSGSAGSPARRCETDSAKLSRAFGNGPGGLVRLPFPPEPEPQPDQVANRPQNRNEARSGSNAGDARIMADRQLFDPKAGALRLEVQLGVEQGRAGHQGRRGLEHLAAHQLETAIDILEPDPIQQPDQ